MSGTDQTKKKTTKRAKPKKAPTKKQAPAQDLELPPPAQGYAPAAAFDDNIAQNRGLPVIGAALVPVPPKGYVPTDPEVRRRELSRIAASLRSEMNDALAEVASRGISIQTDFGSVAPDGTLATPIIARLAQTAPLLAAATSLYIFAQEMDQIAVSDGVVLLTAVHEHMGTRAKNPVVANTYAALIGLFDQQADAIRAGLERAKKAKQPVATQAAKE